MIIYGQHSVQGALKHRPKQITALLLQQNRKDQRIQDVIAVAKKHQIPIRFVSSSELNALASEANHQGIAAEIAESKKHEADLGDFLDQIEGPAFLLILDGVQDPHNLGACLRSADAAGVHAVIAPKDRAVGITPVVQKVASGAVETVPFFQVTNLVRTLELLKSKGIWVIGATEEAERCVFDGDYKTPTALVLGAEGSGVRRLTKEHCDDLVHIPMAGSVASLNVSVATGICLFEVVKQRRNEYP
ncbi:MAG: 23S rRNA (guanosine(2251)-2'-O)-methyltransferase RlmB [Pseudomonadota bacterium]|nr:23S rRNA (guanosine(2251)-2'-O)-methyltransferase RlmB [Gammaproteobacteria bacterium]MBU1559114.1 23S rRNA (guanosine(2251)-2'-O)-methyltransferase RlmB [Gammaproteobacteria bacterium]MBU2546444.1 23S rRNA (guanosine(2251)-2'-O)-methyltransferase RlmB [Gammaproteobacteria bacterium]